MTEPNNVPPVAVAWSHERRTWASLFLFAHLFIVFVAVTTYTRPSGMQDRLHDLFEPYLRNLHLTALPTSYPFARFHLGHATSTDIDFLVEVDVQRPDGTTETISLPEQPLQPGIRWRRYQALANATGTLASGEAGDDRTGILPKSIAAAILRQQDATGGVVRVLGLGLPDENSLGGMAEIARAARENVADIYEANVIVSGTSVELLRKSTTLEIAPIENRPAAPPPVVPAVPSTGNPALPGVNQP